VGLFGRTRAPLQDGTDHGSGCGLLWVGDQATRKVSLYLYKIILLLLIIVSHFHLHFKTLLKLYGGSRPSLYCPPPPCKAYPIALLSIATIAQYTAPPSTLFYIYSKSPEHTHTPQTPIFFFFFFLFLFFLYCIPYTIYISYTILAVMVMAINIVYRPMRKPARANPHTLEQAPSVCAVCLCKGAHPLLTVCDQFPLRVCSRAVIPFAL